MFTSAKTGNDAETDRRSVRVNLPSARDCVAEAFSRLPDDPRIYSKTEVRFRPAHQDAVPNRWRRLG